MRIKAKLHDKWNNTLCLVDIGQCKYNVKSYCYWSINNSLSHNIVVAKRHFVFLYWQANNRPILCYENRAILFFSYYLHFVLESKTEGLCSIYVNREIAVSLYLCTHKLLSKLPQVINI